MSKSKCLFVHKSSVETNWSSARSYFLSSMLSPQSMIFTLLWGTDVLGSVGTSPIVFTTSYKTMEGDVIGHYKADWYHHKNKLKFILYTQKYLSSYS